MTRTRSSNETWILRLNIEGGARHHIFPVNEVTILDHQRDRRAERFSMSNTGQYLNLVCFDLHPTTASIALLAAPELVVDLRDVDRKRRRQTFDNSDKRRSVRFTRCCEFEEHPFRQ